MSVELAYVEHLLPGSSLARRAEVAEQHGFALEIALRPELDVAALRGSGARVSAVHAWGMRELHPLRADPGVVAAARAHVREALELAAELGARDVVTVPGYGEPEVARPAEAVRRFLEALVPFARAAGVRLLVEPLSPMRTSALHDPARVRALLDALDAPDALGLLIDTGHALDGGRDPRAVLREHGAACGRVQLRGEGGTPPSPDQVRAWLAPPLALPAAISVEHHGAIDAEALRSLAAAIRGRTA